MNISTILGNIIGSMQKLLDHGTLKKTTKEDTACSPLVSPRWSLVILVFVLFLLVITKNAWISDDAYITYRTIDNLLHGYGLTWNTTERVQVYTHPLWMMVLAALTWVGRDIYFCVLALSLTISALTIGLLATRFRLSPLLAALAIGLVTASKSFVDYSTSGLENPLTHLILLAFAFVFLFWQSRPYYSGCLFFLASLMLVNRMDAILLLAPVLLHALYTFRSWRTIRMSLLVLFICLPQSIHVHLYKFSMKETRYE